MIRTAKLIFCDNEHGLGNVSFPDLHQDAESLQQDYIAPRRSSQLRKDAKKEGWGRVDGGDYCPGCMETEA